MSRACSILLLYPKVRWVMEFGKLLIWTWGLLISSLVILGGSESSFGVHIPRICKVWSVVGRLSRRGEKNGCPLMAKKIRGNVEKSCTLPPEIFSDVTEGGKE